jgi:hypothetical protein
MKTLKITLLIVCTLLLSPQMSFSQDSNKSQAYWIHEDKVKPSMISEYEQVAKDLVASCAEHNVQGTQWLTVAQNDNTYLYITPIEKFADFDKNPFAALSEKMGNEAVGKLFSRFNPCYDAHGDYVIYLNKELSYMPDGITQTPDGKNYRKFYYNYVTPENDKNFSDNLKKIKELFTNKNSKMEYRIYKSGFGVMGTYYMVAIAAENGQNFEKESDENWENISEEFKPLLEQMNKYTLKSYEKSGWMRPDLAYSPK